MQRKDMNVKDVERHVAELERDGYTIIPDVLSSAELEATREAMEEVLVAEEAVSRKFGLQTEDPETLLQRSGQAPPFLRVPSAQPCASRGRSCGPRS